MIAVYGRTRDGTPVFEEVEGRRWWPDQTPRRVVRTKKPIVGQMADEYWRYRRKAIPAQEALKRAKSYTPWQMLTSSPGLPPYLNKHFWAFEMTPRRAAYHMTRGRAVRMKP